MLAEISHCTLAATELGELIELQGTGEGRAFTLEEQQALVRLCAKGNRELLKLQRAALEG